MRSDAGRQRVVQEGTVSPVAHSTREIMVKFRAPSLPSGGDGLVQVFYPTRFYYIDKPVFLLLSKIRVNLTQA